MMALVLLKVIFVCLNVLIGFYDFSFYRIPNVLLAGLVLLYGLYAVMYQSVDNIFGSLIAFSIVLVAGFIFFALKYIGGGDAKYIAVTSLWVGTHNVLAFIFLVAVLGGTLGLVYLFFKHHLARASDQAWAFVQKLEEKWMPLQYVWIGSGKGAELGKRENIEDRSIPYGVAIALGVIIIMMYVSF